MSNIDSAQLICLPLIQYRFSARTGKLFPPDWILKNTIGYGFAASFDRCFLFAIP